MAQTGAEECVADHFPNEARTAPVGAHDGAVLRAPLASAIPISHPTAITATHTLGANAARSLEYACGSAVRSERDECRIGITSECSDSCPANVSDCADTCLGVTSHAADRLEDIDVSAIFFGRFACLCG